MPARVPNHPMSCQPWLALLSSASVRMVLIGVCRPRRPSMTSAIIMGMPKAATQMIYTSTKALPPCTPVR